MVTYVPPPLRLAIDRLVPASGTGKPVVPRQELRGRIAFPEAVEQGRVRLQGHILWGDDKAARVQEDVQIRVFVNGFQQPLARLKRSAGAGPLQTPFEADLLLSWDKDNHVSLTVPGQDAAAPSEFVVDCRQPVKQQRLRLLALSPYGKNAAELTDEVLRNPVEPGRATTPDARFRGGETVRSVDRPASRGLPHLWPALHHQDGYRGSPGGFAHE